MAAAPGTQALLPDPKSVAVGQRLRTLLADRRTLLVLLVLVTLAGAGARVFHLDIPAAGRDGLGYIFDERYYVNAARVIAGIPLSPDDTYFASSPAGTDPNGEHPQLGKVVIAAFIRVLGDRSTSWRLPAVIFGLASMPLLYWLVLSAGGSPWLALVATAIAAAENLWLVSSRIAVLDIFCVPFMLAGAAFYLRGRAAVAGLFIGVGATMKEFAAYTVFVLALIEAMRGLRHIWERRGRPSWRRIASPFAMTAVAVVTFFTVLAILDYLVTPFRDGRPLDRGQAPACSLTLLWSGACNHFAAMNGYSAALRYAGEPRGFASYPWQFWLDQKDIHYYRVTRTYTAFGVVTAVQTVVDFQGLINPLVLGTSVLGILLSGWWAVRRRDDISFLVTAWTLGTWLPPELYSIANHRVTYLYYMVVTMPALYVAAARVLRRRGVPGWLVGVWVVLFLMILASLYPLKTLAGD